jgi:LPS-assembly lipoprotein
MKRRTLLAAATLPPLLLGGCGFALRRPPPLAFERLALVGFAPRSPVAEALRRALPETVTVVEAPQQAQVVLEALRERREKGVVAITAYGQVRDLQVRVRFGYRLSTRAGKPLLPPTELLLFRDMSYSENIALAKELEQEELYRDMENDIAQQVLRRLQAVQEI